MACSAAGVALMWSVLTGEPVPQPRLAGLTVGLIRVAPALGGDTALPASAAAEAYVSDLERLGACVVEAPHSAPREDLWPVLYAEARDSHRTTLPSRADEYAESCRTKLEAAQSVEAAALETAYGATREWRRYEPDVDLYLSPTFGLERPAQGVDKLELRRKLPAFLRPINFLGWARLAIGELQLAAPAAETVLAAGPAWEHG